MVLCLATVVFAGGGKDAAPAAGGSTAPAAPAQAQEIRVLLANHPYGDLIKPFIPEFEQQSGIKVIVEQLQEAQLNQKLTTEFATGASSVDVFMTRPLQETLLFNKNGWMAPLNNYDFSDYPPSNVDIGRKDGKPYVVPLVVEWEVLYYRKDLLRAAGLSVPTTFAELENAARILNKDGVSGFGSRGAGAATVTQLSSFVYSYGGLYVDKGVAAFDKPAALDAIRFYGKILGNYAPQGITSMSWEALIPVFQAGKLAMWTDACVFYAQLADPTKTQIPAENIGIARFPSGPQSTVCFPVAWGMAISSKTRNLAAAEKFLNWATSKEFAVKGMLGAITMSRNSAWQDPTVKAGMNPELVATQAHASTNGYPYDRPFMSSVGQARDLIGEVVIESINTKGASAGLQALATKNANAVNDLLKADGEYGK
jgi:multiple sugar transport system substrate-binding protein